MVQLSKPWGISMEYIQYLNVDWAEIVSVDHISPYNYDGEKLCGNLVVEGDKNKLESNLRKLFTRRVLK